jgi:putative ABC transport system permease protein
MVLSPGALEGAPLTYLAAVHLPETVEGAVLREVSRRLPNVSAVQIRDVLAAAARVIDRIGTVFRGMAGIALLAGALVLAGALSAEQHRRITEAVIYKVCGATRRDVLAVFGAEFLLAGVTAAVLSCVTGTVAAYAVVYGLMDLRFALYPTSLVLTALLATATTIGLGLLGTARALSRKPSQTLREG